MSAVEYLIQICMVPGDTPDYAAYLQNWLNGYGAQGWEICGYERNGDQVNVTFKRGLAA